MLQWHLCMGTYIHRNLWQMASIVSFQEQIVCISTWMLRMLRWHLCMGTYIHRNLWQMARMISFLQDPKKVTILYRILHEFLWAVWYVSGRINAVIMITPYSFFVYTNSCFVLPYFLKINSSAHKLIFREHNIISNPLFQHKMPPKPTMKAGPRRHSALTKTDNTYRSQSTSPQFPSSWKETDLVDQVAVVNAIKSIDSIKSVPED